MFGRNFRGAETSVNYMWSITANHCVAMALVINA